MSSNPRTIFRMAFCVLATLTLATHAFAFYPFGFFDTQNGGSLTFVKWPLDVLDVNGDGDVNGPNEGVELNFETGNGDDGFTTAEVDKVFAGYEEWENVSTAYIAFFRGQDIVDPVELTADVTQIDAFNVVVFESTADIAAGQSLTGGSLGITLVTNTFEDAQVTIGGSTVLMEGAQMLDVDTVIAQTARDIEITDQGPILKGISTTGAGLTIGMGYSPLHNFDPTDSAAEGTNIEDRVMALRNADGTLGLRGVTSSMYNDFSYYKEESGALTDSHQDLAPDDIAGLTFIYPRSDVDIFFNLDQRARTQTRQGLPSQPLAGTWIRAWCDADNNSGTSRVPFVDTFTGYYENVANTDFRGHFKLKGLFKQLETITQTTFQPTYTISSSEFLPDIFGGDERAEYDNTHQGAGFGFDTLFPAEVFREGESGNLLGLQNVNQGTPLRFDLNTRKIVSATTGKTLDVLLASGKPMFGEENQTCPLNVVVSGINAVEGPKVLRELRDRVLLSNAVGTALMDAYYRAAPTMADYLIRHAGVLAAARSIMKGFEWMVVHAEVMCVAVGALLAAMMLRNRMRRRALTAAALLVMASVPFAQAQMVPFKDISDIVAASDDVVQGTVETTNTFATDDGLQIYTDVTIKIEDTAKGKLNKSSDIHLRLPTGRVGAIGRSSQQLPEFEQGEEVFLFLQDSRSFDHVCTGAKVGKFAVKTDSETGEKFVVPTVLPAYNRLVKETPKMAKRGVNVKSVGTDGKTKDAASTEEGRIVVGLEDFKSYIRTIDKEQKKQE
ncbi:MAG: CFI-box-CTERM domain-containing protein [Candidatus Hydrogenedentales bacterium]